MSERKKRDIAGDKTICVPMAEGIGVVRDVHENKVPIK
jgi:hypothetical protein